MSIYLQIPNLLGDSSSRAYPYQFELGSISWNGTITAQINGRGQSTLSAVSVSKLATIHSPTFMFFMASQKNIGTIVITLTRLGDNSEIPVEVYTLENAVLTNFSQTADSGTQPIEFLGFIFSRVTFTQFAYNSRDEKTSEDSHFWNVRANNGS